MSRARAPSRARGDHREISSDEGGERHTLPRGGGGGGHEPKVAEWGEVEYLLNN